MPVRKLQPLEAKMNQEHVAQYVFRRLPSIAELTKIWGDGKSWGPEMDGFSDRCDALAIRLFGLKTSETIPRFYDDVSDFGILVGERFLPMTRELGDVFDAQFDITKAPHHVKLAAYLEAGWDVSDGQGYEHPLLNRFERPLLCGLADLIPGGELPAAGTGLRRRSCGIGGGMGHAPHREASVGAISAIIHSDPQHF